MWLRIISQYGDGAFLKMPRPHTGLYLIHFIDALSKILLIEDLNKYIEKYRQNLI